MKDKKDKKEENGTKEKGEALCFPFYTMKHTISLAMTSQLSSTNLTASSIFLLEHQSKYESGQLLCFSQMQTIKLLLRC